MYSSDIKSSLRQQPRVNYRENKKTMSASEESVHFNTGPGSSKDNEVPPDPTDDDLQEIQEKLAAAKKKQEELQQQQQRKSRYTELMEELRQIEASTQQMSETNDGASKASARDVSVKKKKASATTKTLKENESVQRNVDKLMGSTVGKNFRSRRSEDSTTEDDSSSSLSSSSSSSETESSDERSSRRKRYKKKKNKRDKSRDSRKKKRSGKDSKSSSKVLFPQEWPHNHIGQHLATKTKRYEQLTMAEFCAGYASIMEEVSDRRILKYRLRHFKDLMYLASRYSWPSILSFHGACLYEIEHGTKKWGSSFRQLETTTLYAAPPPRKGGGKHGGEPILFCGAFQKDACTHTKDHEGLLKGETKMLKHICAHCWLTEKKFASHSQSSCPSKSKEEED